jgi:uncharacterized protein YndB with AHSA1/START domain
MKVFAVQTSICATAERIWALLTDAAGYTRWNNTVEKVDGKIARGERVTVHPKINARRAFPVTVAEFEPSRYMVWTGGMPLGLFKGERTFTLKTSRSIPNLQPAFEEFASDLKRAAEAT